MFNVVFYNEVKMTDEISLLKPSSKCFLNTLENGSGLFFYNPLIENVNLKLNSLKNGTQMFY